MENNKIKNLILVSTLLISLKSLNTYALENQEVVDDNSDNSEVNTKIITPGWHIDNDNSWYQYDDGTVAKGLQEIDKEKYYFNDKGIMQKGFITIDDKLYFFSKVNGVLKKGWQNADNRIWYQEEDGSVFIANGLVTLNNKEYYFVDNFIEKGLVKIDDKTYYFDDTTYEKKYGKVSKKYREIHLDEKTGEYIKTQYVPEYYNQKDSSWENIRYGFSTLGKTGCSPTSMAMAFTSILNRKITPNEVADYLYYNTNQYNKIYSGTSGKGIIYASDKYGIKHKGISTKEQLIEELNSGRIVYAAMGNGKFATLKWNHAIIIYSYNEKNNTTIARDPLNRLNNGMVSIDTIWKEKSTDPDDLSGGYALYSLYVD